MPTYPHSKAINENILQNLRLSKKKPESYLYLSYLIIFSLALNISFYCAIMIIYNTNIITVWHNYKPNFQKKLIY